MPDLPTCATCGHLAYHHRPRCSYIERTYGTDERGKRAQLGKTTCSCIELEESS